MYTSTRYYSNRLRRFSTAWAILMCLLLAGFLPTPVKAQLGSRVVVGYFHNWNAAQAPYIRLRDVNTKYNVINIAFAVPVSHGDMTMTFAPLQQSKAEFIADIQALQAQGRRVQISIGGADAPIELHTAADRDKFVSSMKTIIAEYGFDGYDIDLEGTSVILNNGDTDFKNPTTPKINNLVSASREIVNYFRGQGKNFWLTAAPETQYVQGGYGYYGTAFGGYLPVLYGLRDLLTFVHVQYYNTGSQVALDEKIYSQGTADFIVAMTDMLLKGFPVARNTANVFPALREDQVAFGLPATNTGAAPAGGYVAPAQVYQALNYLIKGISYGGQYATSKSYPNLRGIMTWSVNWDKTQGDAFANSYYSYFSGLGGNTLPTVSITSPANNATFSPGATVTIAANASDSDGSVSKVEFFQNGTKLGEDTSSPYSYSWGNVAAGSYILTAKATDNLGGATTSAGVSISVTSTTNTPPTVSISSPTNGAAFTAPASITISANAADADGTVSKVEFYNGSTKLGEDTASPYTYTWSSVAAGSYTLTAKATDNLNASTTSSTVSVTVTGSSDNCSSVVQYVENGGYVAGSVVKNAGSKYECKPWPYSGWCNGAAWAYGPGTGMYWQDAWTLVSSCSGLQAQSLVTLTDLSATAVAAAATDFKVVGYMPSWSGSASAIQYSKVTHINYAFIRPTTTGGLTAVDNGQKLSEIVSLAHANGVKVGIAVGGWSDLNNTDFQTMAANASYRANFINNLISLINNYQLDGVDIDWEYPVEGQDPANFSTLMTELGNAMHTRGKFLTAAVSAQGYYANGVLSSVFTAVDFLNIMVYDGGNGADHSPYSYAVSSLNYWQGRGLPASKTVLGVPFYARPSWKSFSTLVSEGANPNSDTYNGDYFNGISTIKQKTNLAFDRGLGGMMIWELSQDAGGSNSLLSAIKQVVDERNGSGTTQSPYGGTVRTIPGKIEAEHYDLGGQGVAYNDLSAGNSGSAFRSDNVDLEASTDTGTGYNVGWVQAGEWLEYTVNVATAGSYTLEVRVAAIAAGNSFHIELDGVNVSGTITVPNTTGWQTWQSVTVTTSSLTAGQKVLRIVMDSGDFNINYVNFSSSTTNPAPSVSITSPSSGTTYTAPATLTINASASDNGSVTKVEFFNGSTKLGEDTSSPYAYTWSNVTAGTYSITAKATDNGGATATSSAVSITVNSTTGGCGGAPQYVENGGYVAGSQVQNAGSLYQCREWPYSGWCNGAAWAYGPGTGAYWQDAWTLVASCSSQSLAAASVSENESGDIVIYPNPGVSNKQQTVTFTFGSGAGDVTVQLKTADGNNFYTQRYPDTGTSLSVELPALSPGLYLIRIEGERSTWVRRYIIK